MNNSYHSLPNISKNHQSSLNKLCRICGRCRKDLRKINTKFKESVKECCNIDLYCDSELQHPLNVCNTCRVTVERCISGKRDLPSSFGVTEFPFSCSIDCWICSEKVRPEFKETHGRSASLGRPPTKTAERSPLGFICNKCGSSLFSVLGHVCDPKDKAVDNFQARLQRNSLDEPVASKIIKNKAFE